MRKLSRVHSTFLCLTFACATPALAADLDQIDTIVVTATRTAQPREHTGTSISVITAQDLANRQIVAVSDALAETPGLTIVRNGGLGQTTAIGLRGATAGQSLVLIDGVRINDPSATDGPALIGDVLVNNIERIEVLRGPQSTLYGSDAIGGVINILSKRGGPTPFALTASGEAGSFDTYRLNAAANGTARNVDYGAAINFLHSNGISAADARNGNTETDGYRNFGATGTMRWHLSDTISLDLRSYYTSARADYDGYPPPIYTFQDDGEYSTNMLLTGYAGINADLFGGRLHNRIAVIGLTSKRKSFDDPSLLPLHEAFLAKGKLTRFEYEGVFDLNRTNQITFGAETQRSTLKTHSGYDPTPVPTRGHTRIDSVYGQWVTTLFDSLTLSGGIRHDHDQSFGGHTSAKVTGAWQVWHGTTLRANYGDGFKAPTLYELFSQYSNPVTGLAPEKARGWEAGIDQNFLHGRIRASLTYFERKTKDQIDFFSCFGVTTPACTLRAAQGGYYYNVTRTRARGFEFAVRGEIVDGLNLSADYTNMTAIDRTTGTDLARRPHIMANANLNWSPRNTWSLGAGLSYVGKRYDGSGGFNPLASHTLVNLFGAYPLSSNIDVYGRVENLFDVQYEPVAGYGAPGRAAYMGIRLRT